MHNGVGQDINLTLFLPLKDFKKKEPMKNLALLEDIAEKLLLLLSVRLPYFTHTEAITEVIKGPLPADRILNKKELDAPPYTDNITILAHATYTSTRYNANLTKTRKKKLTFTAELIEMTTHTHLTFDDTEEDHGWNKTLSATAIAAILGEINGVDLAMRNSRANSPEPLVTDYSLPAIEIKDPKRLAVAMNKILPHYGLEPIDISRSASR